MEKRVCLYCGTVYPDDAEKCPICGGTALEENGLDALDDPELKALLAEEPEQSVHTTHAYQPAKGGARLAKNHARKKREEPAPAPAQDAPAREDEAGDAPQGGRIPVVLKVLIGVVLALAVAVLALFAAFKLGAFTPKKPADNTVQEDENEDVYLPLEDAEPDVDLSVCTALKLANTVLELTEPGEMVRVSVMTEPEGCTAPVSYTSADTKVATVSGEGMVLATGAGETEITVTCGEQQMTCRILCTFEKEEPTDKPEITERDEPGSEPDEPEQDPEEKPEYALNIEDMTMRYRGETAQLRVRDAADGTITWSSGDAAVATVSERGLVTAKSNGTARIYAEVDGVKLSCIVRCNLGASAETDEPDEEDSKPDGTTAEEDGYTLSHDDVTLPKDDSFRLTLSGDTVPSHSWSVADSSVCTVDDSGNVRAVGSGTTKVSTSVGGVTYSCIVRVP